MNTVKNHSFQWLILAAAALAELCFMALLSPAATAAGGGPEITYVIAQDTAAPQLLLDHTAWYRVPEPISGQRYLLAVADGDSTALLAVEMDGERSAVWTYSLSTMGDSKSSTSSSLSALDYSVSWDINAFKLSAKQQFGPGSPPPEGGGKPPSGSGGRPGPGGGGGLWAYQDGLLSYSSNNVTYYLSWDGYAFGCTAEKGKAAKVMLYTDGPELGRCITAQPTAAAWAVAGSGCSAPHYTVGTQLAAPEITWYVDGAEAGTGTDFTAASLGGLTETGRHSVCCVVSGKQDGYYYRQTSLTVNFFVCSGVLDNSFLIFSDVHESYENIGAAIEEVMDAYGGKIPALVICTDDWVNGSVGRNETTLTEVYLPQIRGQLGGLDTVYVGGNHDNMAAAVRASVDAGLGATAEGLQSGAGLIFDAGTAAQKGTNSALATGLAVYGINYYALETGDGYSYASVLEGLEAFLAERAADYRGELIVVAAHAGLHMVEDWNGENEYNINASAALVELLNEYAENDRMDILFLFGHDHTRQETEFFLDRGDTLVSTDSFADKTTVTETLAFLYGHSGYLTGEIGGKQHYSLFIWNTEEIQRDFAQIGEAAETAAYRRLATVKLGYDANGGSGTMDGHTLLVGTELSLRANAYTRPGWRFTGWNTAADGSGDAYADGQTLRVRGCMTLYAQWETAPSFSYGETAQSVEKERSDTVLNPDGSVTKTVTQPDGARTVTTAAADGCAVTLHYGADGTLTAVEAEVSKTALEAALERSEPIALPLALPAAESPERAVAVRLTLPDFDVAGALPAVELTVEGAGPGTVALVMGDDGSLTPVKGCRGALIVPVDGSCTLVIADNAKTFPDVGDHWAKDAIAFVSARGILNGTDLGFEPERLMTRAMVAQLLYNFDRSAAPGIRSAFIDVAEDAWYADAVSWAGAMGYMQGYGDSFGPDDAISRQDLVTVLYRFELRNGLADDTGDAALDGWPDAADVADYAGAAMAWAVRMGILNGMDGALNPRQSATRAQVATILYRLVSLA